MDTFCDTLHHFEVSYLEGDQMMIITMMMMNRLTSEDDRSQKKLVLEGCLPTLYDTMQAQKHPDNSRLGGVYHNQTQKPLR